MRARRSSARHRAHHPAPRDDHAHDHGPGPAHGDDHHHHHHQRPIRTPLAQLGSPILAMSAPRRLAWAAGACLLVWAAVAWAILLPIAGAG